MFVRNLSRDLIKYPIILIDEQRVITLFELNKLSHGEKIVVCDAYVDNIENIAGVVCKKFGFVIDNIMIIDHHAPQKRFAKHVSSTNLAVEYVREFGIVDENTLVVINHTDADSILSSLIIRGILPSEKIFEDAAISADHTGKENPIADLLQALKSERNIELSLRNLHLLLQNKSLEEKAQKLVQKRFKERKIAKKMVGDLRFSQIGKVVYLNLDEIIDSVFWSSLLPNANIILTFSPGKDYGNWIARTRIGLKVFGTIKLNEIGINDFDKEWGGRWNTGSNSRGKGTRLPIYEYALLLNIKLEKSSF
ncbi:hypothetical protein KAJ41_02890 [Candidatus Parcubacteria bacterium]|nr:hypothetical protein [Candidatus Parcubacteria bacterium]